MSRVAVVTGGASGIGLGVARQFVADNYPVAILDRNKATLKVAATELQSAGGTILALETDVADQAAVDDAFARVRSELGPVAILVTSVGIEAFEPFLDHHAGTLGADHLGEPHGDVLLRSGCHSGHGGSRLGADRHHLVAECTVGAPDMAHYSASKGGVIALTKSLAVDFA